MSLHPARTQSPDRQDAFRAGILLRAAECCEYSKEWVRFKISGKKIRFHCRDTVFKAVLSIPTGSDAIWCRVHGLTWLDPNGADDSVEIPPFFFPLDMRRLLRLRPIPDDGDSSFD